MKEDQKLEGSALALASLLLLEAMGMQLSPIETRGAVFALFIGAFVAWILSSAADNSRR